jgi:NADPH:quinone reductase-like Zn-dependent oxidoreductase
MTEMMKAVQINQYGGDEVLEVVEVPVPTPGPDDVLVKIHAAGLNYYDVKIRNGWLSRFFPLRFPHTLGNDFAGEVVAKGDNVSQFEIGDRVYGMITVFHGGTYAEYISVPANIIRKAPANVSLEEAAALPMVMMTAWIALAELGELKEGDNVLVHGGDVVIDYKTTDFREVCKDIDIVMDPIGGETNLHSYEVMRPGGTIAVVLREDAVEMANREPLSKKYDVEVKVVAFDLRPDLLDTVRDVVESGEYDANIKHSLSLDEARQAHQILQTMHPGGRIVLTTA